MSPLILVHIAAGLVGIACGLIAIVGMWYRRPLARLNAVFLGMTAIACVTGFVFLPTVGITSAQLVAFFVAFLLILAVYARYVRRLVGSWNQVCAFAAVGALFLNILITAAQSFQRIPALKALAATQQSPVYVAVKIALLLVFVVIALITAKRAGRS